MDTCIFASAAVPDFGGTSLKYIVTISRVQRQQERKLDGYFETCNSEFGLVCPVR